MKQQLSYQQYYNSVLGGWLGKFIGGTLGAPMEGEKVLHEQTYYSEVPEVADWNDDNDFQLMWLMLLEKSGPHISARDMAKFWREQIRYPWDEYGYAGKNWQQGIWPPTSGWFNNDYFCRSMGCPVRSEIWAFLHPGVPERAVQYARLDGSLDHASDSVEAEAFLAAIESTLFFEQDIGKLINLGLEWIDKDCQLAQAIRLCQKLHAQGTDWKLTRHEFLNRYGHPDFTAAVQNLGITVLALLYGEGDFERTILTALNGGYDSDCTCSTAGAIIGGIVGADNIPEKWKQPLNDTFKAYLKEEHVLKISEFAERTCRTGIHLLERMGSQIKVIDLPAGPAMKLPSIEAAVDLDIAYDGLPTITLGTSRPIRLLLSNRTSHQIDCELKILPENSPLLLSPAQASLSLPPGQRVEVPVTAELQKGRETLPHTNFFQVSVSQGKELICKETFGLAGEHLWQAFGAFWDMYDRAKIPPGTPEAHDNPKLPPWDCMFANQIDIDKAYLDETELVAGRQISGIPRVLLSCPEDRIDLDEYFALAGPAIVYLLRQIVINDDRRVWIQIGSNGPLKVWLNGQEVIRFVEPKCGNVGDAYADVILKKGVNTIVLKVGRWSDNFNLRFGIKNHNGRHFHQCWWTTDFQSVVPDEWEKNIGQ